MLPKGINKTGFLRAFSLSLYILGFFLFQVSPYNPVEGVDYTFIVLIVIARFVSYRFILFWSICFGFFSDTITEVFGFSVFFYPVLAWSLKYLLDRFELKGFWPLLFTGCIGFLMLILSFLLFSIQIYLREFFLLGIINIFCTVAIYLLTVFFVHCLGGYVGVSRKPWIF